MIADCSTCRFKEGFDILDGMVDRLTDEVETLKAENVRLTDLNFSLIYSVARTLNDAHAKIKELDNQVTSLSNALLMLCTAAVFEEEQIPGQMSILDFADPCSDCEEETCEGCPELDDMESEDTW